MQTRPEMMRLNTPAVVRRAFVDIRAVLAVPALRADAVAFVTRAAGATVDSFAQARGVECGELSAKLRIGIRIEYMCVLTRRCEFMVVLARSYGCRDAGTCLPVAVHAFCRHAVVTIPPPVHL